MKNYDHNKIDKKWQERWEKKNAYSASDESAEPKDYLLIEFPYPSGDGLHVGHVRSWTALDVVARKRRAQGRNVLYPIGWDAFGLPTENYALKTGKDPRIVTKENTDKFKQQIKSLGLSFDWSREINTTDPSYYRWTQWIFLLLYKKGLAYKAKTLINWCPKDKIGLANEEVIDGCCERCGTPVVKREKEQWMMAITKYAQRLYDDLDTVDYIERAKTQQRNWIGPSEGAEIDFELVFKKNPADNDRRGPNGEKAHLTVFTTRPDTLFGATYMVVAPEHLWITLATDDKHDVLLNKDEVKAYVEKAKNTSEIDRTTEGKEKTGVKLNGVVAINPATKEEIPIFVADYVLGGYGTGAIMAVPAHDQRDRDFATKFNVPIKQVIAPYIVVAGLDAPRSEENIVHFDAETAIIKHWDKDLYYIVEFNDKHHGLVGGSVEAGEKPGETAARETTEESGYKNIGKITQLLEYAYSRGYKTRKTREELCNDRVYVVELKDDERTDIIDEHTKKGSWKTAEEILKDPLFINHHRLYIELHAQDKQFTEAGILVNSGAYDGVKSEDAKKQVTEFVGGKKVTTFKLRDWVFSRQRYWGEPIPMIHCDKCGIVPVPEDQLPVVLPEVEKYQPTDTGESPLANITDWVNVKCPQCDGDAKRETDVMPNWAGSSWYYLRYTDPQNDKAFASQNLLKYWTPVDWYNGGMEHTVLHLLYSRFWHKFLFDEGLVPSSEPYMKRTSHGLILAEDGSKMSKSKGNSVSPDQLVENVGADSLRLYEMFLGPFDQPVAWNNNGVVGMRRFLERVADLIVNDEVKIDPKVETLLNQTVKKVTEDIENLKMNTAVSAMMILLNECEKADSVTSEVYGTFLKLLAPFAPHLAHELWEQAGQTTELRLEPWPVADESKLKGETTHITIQINGKMRGEMEIATDSDKDAVEAAAREAVAKHLEGKSVTRVVVVLNRLVNFVVEE